MNIKLNKIMSNIITVTFLEGTTEQIQADEFASRVTEIGSREGGVVELRVATGPNLQNVVPECPEDPSCSTKLVLSRKGAAVSASHFSGTIPMQAQCLGCAGTRLVELL
jgi:hypothetical protein